MKSLLRNICPSLRAVYWLPVLLLSANDAYAWGLYTHVWYAQALLWLVPLADPRMRAAALRFPRLVLAGSCLPDLAIVGGLCGTDKFENTHEWERAAVLLKHAQTDEERAMALGYASHLLTDIFAHHHFVPAHESVWVDMPFVTHALCEWSLDHHVAPQLFHTPASLLRTESSALSVYLCREFACSQVNARAALKTLANGDSMLRHSRLPALALSVGRVLDRRMVRRFNHYLSQTTRRLEQINRVIAGDEPIWVANPERHAARLAIAGQRPAQLRSRMPLPGTVFSGLVTRPGLPPSA